VKLATKILHAVPGTRFFAASRGMMHRVNAKCRVRLAWIEIAPKTLNALATLPVRTRIPSIVELISTMHQQTV